MRKIISIGLACVVLAFAYFSMRHFGISKSIKDNVEYLYVCKINPKEYQKPKNKAIKPLFIQHAGGELTE